MIPCHPGVGHRGLPWSGPRGVASFRVIPDCEGRRSGRCWVHGHLRLRRPLRRVAPSPPPTLSPRPPPPASPPAHTPRHRPTPPRVARPARVHTHQLDTRVGTSVI